ALNSDAQAGEIVVGLVGVEALFEIHFLHADIGVGAPDALLHAGVDQAVLAGQEVVDVEFGRDFNFVFDGFETGAAPEEIEGEGEILLGGKLASAAEEAKLAGKGRALIGRNRDAVEREGGVAGAGEGEEQAPPQNGKIGLELIAVEWVPPA